MESGLRYSLSYLISPLLVIVLFAGAAGAAGPPLVLRNGKNFYPLGHYLDVLKDSSGKLTIADVTTPQIAGEFVNARTKTPAFGLGDAVYWLRFRVINKSSKSGEWLLEENFPLMDYFDLYIPGPGGSYIVKRAGKMEPFAGREIPNRNPVFPLPAKSNRFFYIRASVDSTIVFPMAVLTRSEFLKRETMSLLGFGLYFGIMFAMALYNLYLYFFMRDKIYLYYVLYVVAFAMLQTVINGFSRQFLFPDSPVADYYAMRLLIVFPALASMLFSRTFLQSNHYAPCMDKLLLLLIWADVLLVPLLFILPGLMGLIALDANTLLTPLLSAATGVVCYLKGYKPARYYLLARACLYASVCAFVIGNTVLRLDNFITWHGMLPGSILDVVLLSLALADRVSVMREEKNKAEAEAASAAGRALIGDMAAGVAHEVNNPLAGIILCFKGLKNSREGDANRPELIAAVEMGLAKIQNTVAQLLNFSRLQAAEIKPEEINVVIRDILLLCKYQLDKEGIEVATALSGDLPPIPLDKNKMGQVLANLILNAAHAMKGGGKLTIQTQREGKWCTVSVADTGPGISAGVMPRIFEPFFTTKPAGEGTGLGLYVSKNIVEAHGGHMEVKSSPCEGTTCYIRLPLAWPKGLA